MELFKLFRQVFQLINDRSYVVHSYCGEDFPCFELPIPPELYYLDLGKEDLLYLFAMVKEWLFLPLEL